MSERRLSLSNIEYALHRSHHVLSVDLERLSHHVDNLQFLLNKFHNPDDPHENGMPILNNIVRELTHTNKTVDQLVQEFQELRRLLNFIESKPAPNHHLQFNFDISTVYNNTSISLERLSDVVLFNIGLITEPSTPRQVQFKEKTWNIWKIMEPKLEQLKTILDDIHPSNEDSSLRHRYYQRTVNSSESEPTPASSPWKNRLQKAALPLTGAALGAVMAGPVGFMVGAKMGAALGLVGGGVVGLTGGGIVSKVHEHIQSHKRITSEKVELSPLIGENSPEDNVNNLMSRNSFGVPPDEEFIEEAVTPVIDEPYGRLVLTDSVMNPERGV